MPLVLYGKLQSSLQLMSPEIINIGSSRPNIYFDIKPFKYPMNSFRDVVENLLELATLQIGGEHSGLFPRRER
jgi:hypothetical protein